MEREEKVRGEGLGCLSGEDKLQYGKISDILEDCTWRIVFDMVYKGIGRREILVGALEWVLGGG